MSKERIDRIISSQTGVSRNDVRKHMKKKSVYVNGELCTDVSLKVDPLNDEIVFLGERIVFREHIYLMMNKPENTVCALKDARDRTVLDLVHEKLRRKGFSPCGRLDKDTTGLLILTDDGELIHRLISPSKNVYKTYMAELDSEIDEKAVEKAFEEGIEITDKGERYVCRKAFFRKTADRLCEIRICEGRFHQVKKMCAAVGYGVVRLKRTAVGELFLDESLLPGEVRELREDEINMLSKM